MKLLFDENLSHQLVEIVAHEFPDCAHIRDIGQYPVRYGALLVATWATPSALGRSSSA